MNDAVRSTRRRGRRRDGAPVGRGPEQSTQHTRRRPVDSVEALSTAAIVVICLALLALIWINTARAVREQADDQRGRVEAALTAQAATLAIQAEHELLTIDQSLAIIQAAWDQDPDTTRLDDWQKKMPALTAVTRDLFIANQQRIIVQDILPAAVGQGIGAAYGNFANGSLEPLRVTDPALHDAALLVGELGSDAVTRQYVMYLVRPLLRPQGWLVGASYHSDALSEVFAVAGLGHGGLAALVDTHRGGVEALAGGAAVHPTVVIANTMLYREMTADRDSGVWIGRMPIDGVDRIVAFHRVPGRDLVALVAETTEFAMGPANGLATVMESLAVIAALLVVGIGTAIVWEIWHWRLIGRNRRLLAQAQALHSSLQVELGSLRQRAATDEMQVRMLMPLAATGVAAVDAQDRLTSWNQRFGELLGVPPDFLREGLTLDDLLRRPMTAGRTEAPADLEAGIVRRLARLRGEAGGGNLDWTAPDGSALLIRAQPLPNGGLLLVVQGAVEEPPEQAAADTVEL